MPAARKATADLEAVDLREHDVEDDHVVLGGAGVGQALLAVEREVGGVLGARQPLDERLAQSDLVFDHQ